MLNWLSSRPLQIKFFVSTILLFSTGLLVFALNVFQLMNQFLLHHVEDDMQQRTHILAMAMMMGPAAHNPDDMRKLLGDVSAMHGYCYLTVLDKAGNTLATAGNGATALSTVSGAGENNIRNGCFKGDIPLIHDGKPFGLLRYGMDTSFVDTLETRLRSKLLLIAAMWFALGTSVYFLLVRKLVQPLKEITHASELMAQGDLNSPMPRDLPRDELGKLAASFSRMATVLRERIELQQSYSHALYAEQARLNALVSILPVGIFFVDPSHKVQYINQECRRLWGLSENKDYLGKVDSDLIADASNQLEQPDAFMQNVATAVGTYGVSEPFDTPIHSGKMIRSRSCVVPDATGHRYIGRVWMFEDVSREHARLDEAQARAERDKLTGLYNRRRFEQDLERLFAQVQRDDRHLTLLYFNLDNFKSVNDEHGHAAGNMILKSIGQTLTLNSRRNENFYRLDSDDFAILIVDAEERHIEILAQRVISTIGQLQFSFSEHRVQMHCSMGISTYSPNAGSGSSRELLQQAEAALHQAKHLGKNRWYFHNPAHPLDLGKDSR